jgi:hypothetical protein
MKRWLAGAVALVLVAGGGWFWVSPIMAMQALKTSALAGDRDALSEEVDFSAVRESLKSQLKAAMIGKMAADANRSNGDGSNGLAALGAMFAMAVADSAIDAVVSADGIKSLVAAGKLQKPGEARPDDTDNKPPEWVIERKGLDRFTAHPVGKDNDRPPVLVFTRTGLSWRLTDIVLPGVSAK